MDGIEMFKKIRKVSLALLAVLLIVSLASAFLTYVVILNTGVIKAQSSEDPLEAYSEVSYIVWQYNSTYYACRNMSLLSVSPGGYFNTSDDEAIQFGIDKCSSGNGGTVYVKCPTYTDSYNAEVTLKDKVTLIIEQGALGITVTIDSGATATLLDYANFNFMHWDSGTLTSFGESLVNPSGYSFVIRKTGDTYIAHNGTTGLPAFYGTNASQNIQNAVNGCPSGGGTIFLRTAIYTLDTTIIIEKDGITLDGESWNGTILEYSGTNEAIRLGTSTKETYHNTVENLFIKLTNSNSVGIRLIRTFRFHIYKVRTQCSHASPQTTALLFEDGGSSYWVGQGNVDNCQFRYNLVGLNFSGRNSEINVKSTTIRSVSKTYSGSYGIWGRGGSGGDSDTLKCYNVHFAYVETAIFLTNTPSNMYDCMFSNCRVEQASTGIHVKTNYNSFYQCSFAGSVTTKVNTTDIGDENRFYDCYGFRTKYWGSPNGITDGGWLAHNLAGSPNFVVITPESNVTVWLEDKNATHIQIGVASGSVNINWYAEYQP